MDVDEGTLRRLNSTISSSAPHNPEAFGAFCLALERWNSSMPGLIGQTLLEQFRVVVDAFIASGGVNVLYCVWDLKPCFHNIILGDTISDGR